MKTEIKIEANQETTPKCCKSVLSIFNRRLKLWILRFIIKRFSSDGKTDLPQTTPFWRKQFRNPQSFSAIKNLCKQSQLIQIIEEIRSPKINKSLHDLQSLFKGEALMEASTLANLQVQQDNLLEQALLVGNQVAPCLGFHLRNFQYERVPCDHLQNPQAWWKLNP